MSRLSFGRRGVLASGSRDCTVRLWNTPEEDPLGEDVLAAYATEKLKPRATMQAGTQTVMGLAFSDDGEVLFSGSRDYSVRVFDVNTVCP